MKQYLILLLVSVLAFSSSGFSGNLDDRLGGIRLGEYCTSIGATHEEFDPGRGKFGVACRFGSGGQLQWLTQNDLDSACRNTYGETAYAANDGNDPYGWYCAGPTATGGEVRVGGVEWGRYCRDLGASHEEFVGPNPYDIVCRFGSGGDTRNLSADDIDQACKDVYGGDSYGKYSGGGPETGWGCYKGGVSIKPTGSPTQIPVQEPTVTTGQTEPDNPGGAQNEIKPTPFQPGGDPGESCPGYPLNLSQGDVAKVTPGTPNKLRSHFGLSSNQIGLIPGSDSFTIVGGPICNDTHWWWQVNYKGILGWTAQGDEEENWIELVSPRDTSPTLEASDSTPTDQPEPQPGPVPPVLPAPCSDGGCILKRSGNLHAITASSAERGVCPGQENNDKFVNDWIITFEPVGDAWANYSILNVRFWGPYYSGVWVPIVKSTIAVIDPGPHEIRLCVSSLLLFPTNTWIWLAD